jgi:hypothetical protein
LKRLGNQPLTAKRMRRRDNGYLCRQPLAKLLQSVAISVAIPHGPNEEVVGAGVMKTPALNSGP